MQHLDEGTMHAMLDGELPFAEREAAEAHIATCAECAAAVAEARGFIAASSRILTALDSVPRGVLPEKEMITPGTFHTPPRLTMTRASWLRAGSAIAAVLVLSTITVIARRPGSDEPLAKLAQHDELASPRRTSATVSASAPAPAPAVAAPAEKSAMNAPQRDKSDALAERKDRKAKEESNDRQQMVADAAPDAAPAASSRANTAPALAHFADSAHSRGLVLGSVIVTGGGTGSTSEKRGAAVRSDSAAPTIVSRTSAIDAGDTVVTTVYDVRGVQVSLIDRSPLQKHAMQVEVRGARAPNVMKAIGVAAPVNSITWSDSTGRMRTLRGALTSAELEVLKHTLFGTTP